MSYKYRAMKENEELLLRDLFYNTVQIVNKNDYTQEQIDVWAPKRFDSKFWIDSFLNKIIYLVEDDGEIIGFIDAEKKGYIDRLYVHHKYQRQGIAKELLKLVEKELNEGYGITEYYVHASITAKPFFEKNGYIVLNENIVERNNISLTNYYMKKELE